MGHKKLIGRGESLLGLLRVWSGANWKLTEGELELPLKHFNKFIFSEWIESMDIQKTLVCTFGFWLPRNGQPKIFRKLD